MDIKTVIEKINEIFLVEKLKDMNRKLKGHGVAHNPNHRPAGDEHGGEFAPGDNDPPLVDPSQSRQSITNQRGEIENQIKKRGLSYNFIGYSDAHGMSIYYEIEGQKSRFSTHSVTNIDRIKDELHFDLPFVSEIGVGGKVINKYNRNSDKFKRYFDK